MATTFWLLMGYNLSCTTASDMLFDSRGGFLGTSYPMKTQPRSRSKGRCHGNPFWDYISCKWILTGDNGMGIS